MAVDFKNKLFQKALWGYVPEEVDEYIAYVAGEYAKLEKRLNAIRAENAKRQAEAAGVSGADVPGVGAEDRRGAEEAFAESERILTDARREADAILAQARTAAQTEGEGILADARAEAENIRTAAQTEGEGILADARAEAENLRTAAQTETEGILADARAEAEKLRTAAQTETEGILADARAEAENLRTAAQTEAEEILAQAYTGTETGMEENAVAARTGTVGGESVLAAAKTMRAEAERQFAESGRILTGLHAASERFRRDLAAFSSSMQSLAKNQLSAAERFGEDAQRFLSEMDAFSATDTEADRADGEEDGDIFGFTSAAAMIGDLLKDLPEESGVSEEGGAAAPDPAEGKPAADDTDILLAESALSGQVEEEAGRLLAQLLDMGEIGTENAGVSVNDAETDGGGERAENGNPPALSGEAVPDSTAASSPGEAGSDEGGAESSDGSEEDHEEAAGEDPGDEELAAVMAALSGISEDDSYDAMLAAFQPDEEVDTGLAKHLAKKRRENFRRMMEEAAKALAGESSPAGDGAEKAPASDMSFVSEGSDDAGLEEELTAAVEAAIRADLDPEKALDEMFAALTEGSEDGGTAGSGVPTGALSGEEPGEDPLSTDMLELIDFDAPAEDSPAYTDHSLEEFVSSRSDGGRSDGGRSDGEPPRGEDAG